MERVILHCDMDNYYAAVEEKYNPALKNMPFAVCGDPAMRHSIVMSKNTLAKRAGVKTGISYTQAKQLCPELQYIKADMPKYLAETKAARAVFQKYANRIIPYGMDEAWLELSGGVSVDEARQLADIIRIEIMYSLGLSASVGVSFNYIFSKLGSDYNKPNGTTVITRDNFKRIVWRLPASDLLFVGSIRQKILSNLGIMTIGDIAATAPERLIKILGKVGYDLWCFANGDDRNFKPNNDVINSIGNTITPPSDLKTVDDVSAVIYLLVQAVCARLNKHNLKTRCISICTRDSYFNKQVRQCGFKPSTDNVNRLFNIAYELFNKHCRRAMPLRSVGIRADNLDGNMQLSLSETNECKLAVDMNSRIKQLYTRFGKLELEQTATAKEW